MARDATQTAARIACLRAILATWAAHTPDAQRATWVAVLDIDGTLVVWEGAACDAVPGAVELVRDLHRLGIGVDLVTARHTAARDFTVGQLQALGLAPFRALHMHDWAADGCFALWKRGVRARIARTATIVAALGDQVFDVDTHALLPVLLPWQGLSVCGLAGCTCGLDTPASVERRARAVERQFRRMARAVTPPLPSAACAVQ